MLISQMRIEVFDLLGCEILLRWRRHSQKDSSNVCFNPQNWWNMKLTSIKEFQRKLTQDSCEETSSRDHWASWKWLFKQVALYGLLSLLRDGALFPLWRCKVTEYAANDLLKDGGRICGRSKGVVSYSSLWRRLFSIHVRETLVAQPWQISTRIWTHPHHRSPNTWSSRSPIPPTTSRGVLQTTGWGKKENAETREPF